MAAKTKKPREVYQVKITLLGAKPPIWRRLLIPPGMTLGGVHDAIQAAMGWTDSHLHEFEVAGERFTCVVPFGDGDEDGAADESKVRLSQLLPGVGAKARYTYDFGDGWEHSIVLEKILPEEPGEEYPQCTAGKRACPPEDCGGIYGYYNLLEALRDPAHPEHESLSEWVGGSFDPEAFSIEEANVALNGRPASQWRPF